MLRNGLGGRETVPWGQAFEKAWGKYGATHPEWFALQADGSRGCQHMATGCGTHPQDVKVGPSHHTAPFGVHVCVCARARANFLTAANYSDDE